MGVKNNGLSSQAVWEYHKTKGYNEIKEVKVSWISKIVKKTLNAMSGMLLLAALLSFFSGKIFDGSFIIFLWFANIAVNVWQEHKADTAIEKLNTHLNTSIKVMRDSKWQEIEARELIPDDVVRIESGNSIPADAKIIEAHNVSVNEAALTGESLPKDKKEGDLIYSGSFLASGLAIVLIKAIGNETSFGKTLSKIDVAPKKSALEKDILRISKFLSILSVVAVIILTVVLVISKTPIFDVVRLDLSLIIAGIPISLPTVMSLIIAFGVIELAKKNVVVRRLSSLEELANTDLLLTDKTGTLTKDKIYINKVISYNNISESDARKMAAVIASQDPDVSINKALLEGITENNEQKVINYIPADSTRKRSTLTFEGDNGKETISLGASQIVLSLCSQDENKNIDIQKDITELADRGFRTLVLSQVSGQEEKNMQLVAVFALSDELREDAPAVIKFLEENGIDVVMVTGDNRAIAKEVAGNLNISGTNIVAREDLLAKGFENIDAKYFENTKAFAEILPEDKYKLVEQAKKYYTVASNGDGVNDLPAVKAASVGFAVSNAVDALKGAADIVLLSDGIGVMRDAFIEGRKIFERLYTYSLYRISESFRLIITIVILGVSTGTYPLSPLQLILIALLNDIPIVSLAFDRVRIANRPSKIDVKKQFSQSILYGLVGIVNSLLLYVVVIHYFHLSFPVFETLFFLKLTISGHLLIYVAHTKERWYKFLPSKQVIIATTLTQIVSIILALTGFLMPAPLPWPFVIFIIIWSFVFMQISELSKMKKTNKVDIKMYN